MINVYEIKCHICGTKTGEITHDLGLPIFKRRAPILPKDEDFEDLRCDDCNNLHGTSQEMEQSYWRSKRKNKSHADFKTLLIKGERKKALFEGELKKAVERDTKNDE